MGVSVYDKLDYELSHVKAGRHDTGSTCRRYIIDDGQLYIVLWLLLGVLGSPGNIYG